MKNWEDKHIIEGLRNGDRVAFRELYQKYSTALMRQIFSMTNNREQSEELLHETLITVVEKINFYQEKDGVSFKSWLMRVASNKAIDLLRKKKKESSKQASIEEVPSTEGLSIKKEVYVQLHGEINKLPLLQRSALSLRILDELSYLEISRVLGVSIASIKQAIFKGKKGIKAGLIDKELCDERI